MQTRHLGKNGPAVSAIGLGCMGMSQSYGEADPAEAKRTLLRALDLGITFFDTADVYGAGHNEELVGTTLGHLRGKFFLATKFGITAPKQEGDVMGVRGDAAYVREACEASLKRLGTDVIDLYYLHRVDPEIPIEETVGAMAELVAAGKVRHLGLSEVSATNLRKAHAVHPVTAVQSEYSLWTREVEDKLLPTCRELGVGFVPFSPLGRGFLTGALSDAAALGEKDMRRNLPRFQGENFDKNRALVDAVAQVAAQKGCKPGQLALAWVLAQGEDIVPIPGTKRVAYLEENAAATDISLSASDLARLAEIADPAAIAGERYPEAIMKHVDRD